MNRFLLYSLPWLERNSPKKPFFNFGFGSNMKFPALGPNKKSFLNLFTELTMPLHWDQANRPPPT